MKLAAVERGDIVLVSKGGRRFHAHVKRVSGGVLELVPIERGISYRQAGARDILERWQQPRPRRPDDQDQVGDEPAAAPASSKAQLSLAGRLERPTRA